MTLEARNLSYHINGKTLVDRLSLRAEPGQLLAIVGANGAGKSTLLKMLSGDLKPASGSILMGDKPLHHWKSRDRARVRAVLPQTSTLSFPFTAMEIALMGRAPHIRGIERAEDYAIARSALEAAAVGHLEDRVYTTLSGGERQRVQLARVLAQVWEPSDLGPRYLMVDEPTNNLDLAHQHTTLHVVHAFSRKGTAVIAVLHDLNLAAQYADRILVMQGGQHVAEGAPREVLRPDIIEQAFNIPVMVTEHPHLDCPLIVPVPVVAEAEQPELTFQTTP